jgi:hypothetical protein
MVSMVHVIMKHKEDLENLPEQLGRGSTKHSTMTHCNSIEGYQHIVIVG